MKHIFVAWLLASAAFSASAAVREVCPWDNPGANKFTGSRFAAVMSYDHIPFDVRLRLAVKSVRRKADHVVAVTRSGIEPNAGISFRGQGEVNDMHFGRSEKCASVTRAAWAPDRFEVTDMWCDGTYCIGAPRVCGNIFWTVRTAPTTASRVVVMGVPEPGGLSLILLAGVGLWAFGRRRK